MEKHKCPNCEEDLFETELMQAAWVDLTGEKPVQCWFCACLIDVNENVVLRYANRWGELN